MSPRTTPLGRLAAPLVLCLATAALAEDGAPAPATGDGQHVSSLAAGGAVSHGGPGTTEGEGVLRLETRHLDSSGAFLWRVEGHLDGRYGTVDGTSNGGGTASARAAVGFTTLAGAGSRCGFYGLVGAEGEAELRYPRPAPTDALEGGPYLESGLHCRLIGNLTLLAGPVAELDYGLSTTGPSEHALSLGGQAELWVRDTAGVRARLTRTAAGEERGGSATALDLEGHYRWRHLYVGAGVEAGQVSTNLVGASSGVTLGPERESVPYVGARAVVGVAF